MLMQIHVINLVFHALVSRGWCEIRRNYTKLLTAMKNL